jgi:tRNA (pseudouridine54-N1)-methyltransferase
VRRRFLLLAHRVPVTGNFSLNDLAGAGGRMDEVARATSTAFTVSNGLRRDTELTILFVAEPPPQARRIRLLGTGLRYLNPDERSTAALLKNALVRSSTLEKDIEASPGLVVGPAEPLRILAEFAQERGTVWLTETGLPYTPADPSIPNVGAVLSDPDDPTTAEEEVLRRQNVPPVSLGPVSLRASQCIDVLHNRWDALDKGAEEGSARSRRRDPVSVNGR